MKIELERKQIDAVTRGTIAALEKTNRQLAAQLRRKEHQLAQAKHGMDITATRRKSIQSLAQALMDELVDANWVDCPGL